MTLQYVVEETRVTNKTGINKLEKGQRVCIIHLVSLEINMYFIRAVHTIAITVGIRESNERISLPSQFQRFFLSFLSYKMIDCIRDRFANAVDWQTSVIFVDQIRIQLNTAFKKAGN